MTDYELTNRISGNDVAEQSENSTAEVSPEGKSFRDTLSEKASNGAAEARKKGPAAYWRQFSRAQREMQRRRIQAEQRIKQLRYEEYVKMLRASSLKRRLQEEESRKHSQSNVAKAVALAAYGVEFKKKYSGFF